jgi:hypothetical protein
MKSGNLNFLEPSGPLQTCNGTALPGTQLVIREVTNLFRMLTNKTLRYAGNKAIGPLAVNSFVNFWNK